MPASELTPAMPVRRARAAARAEPWLFLALQCDRPLEPGAGHSLAGVDRVVLGRAEAPVAVRSLEGGQRRLLLGIADRWLSATHAQLRRDGDRFVLEDAGSKNGTLLNGTLLDGTLVNGAPATSAALTNHDVIEVGHTLLLYREGIPQLPDDPADLAAGALAEPAPGLRTFVKPLAIQLARLPLIARSKVPVVITGESGTGKEVVARALHTLSGRAGRFVPVNCGAIAPTLVESELFGHRKGTFTGAVEARPGLVRSADGGTLFLDEIGELSPAGQTALLRVLQESEVLAVGATEAVPVDVRVVAATHQDLSRAIAEGRFRADLYARISGFTLALPPLRWRREDLGLLIAAMLGAGDGQGPPPALTPEAGRALLRHRWPLNLRELEKCLSAARVLADGGPIDLVHLPEGLGRGEEPADQTDPRIALDDLEARPRAPSRPLGEEEKRHREELIALLREHRGNVAAVARVLGKGRMQIHRWVKRYELRLDEYR